MTEPHSPGRPTILIFSQVYVPDAASVGQHMHDAAAELDRRGWRVVVYTASRGYDDPSVRYPARETRDGVDIRRVGLSSFGKNSIAVRLLAQTLFMFQCIVRGSAHAAAVAKIITITASFRLIV